MSGSESILVLLITGLLLAVVIDLREHRIPNWLVSCLVVGGIALQFWFYQWHGLLTAFLGLTVGLFCFLPFHVFGALGAGDVKLLAAVGALIGPNLVFLAAMLTILCGGVIAIAYITFKGGLPKMLSRYGSMLFFLVVRQPQYIPPAPGEAAGLRFPYAIAIAVGTTLAVIVF